MFLDVPDYFLGIERFAEEAASSGIDGVIIPDLPPEEAGPIQSVFKAAGLNHIFLLTPTSDAARIRVVTELSAGFVYLVSLVGVTGARDQLTDDLAGFVGHVRAATDKPLAVGFGISTPQQARQVAHLADGVIVGSALIKAIGGADDPVTTARSFVRSLRDGIDQTS